MILNIIEGDIFHNTITIIKLEHKLHRLMLILTKQELKRKQIEHDILQKEQLDIEIGRTLIQLENVYETIIALENSPIDPHKYAATMKFSIQ